jgi:hypothetical protein
MSSIKNQGFVLTVVYAFPAKLPPQRFEKIAMWLVCLWCTKLIKRENKVLRRILGPTEG